MSMKNQSENSQAVPFFARYLEGQFTDVSAEEAEKLAGGKGIQTRKAPSDSDEDFSIFTMKHPSDSDDVNFDINMFTRKHPSDSDEDSSMFTRKYPSDNDE